jgi:hypothetical protein
VYLLLKLQYSMLTRYSMYIYISNKYSCYLLFKLQNSVLTAGPFLAAIIWQSCQALAYSVVQQLSQEQYITSQLMKAALSSVVEPTATHCSVDHPTCTMQLIYAYPYKTLELLVFL